MAVNPESLKVVASAYLDELKSVMAEIPDFPALVELASRLEGKDRKTCELALYTLKKQDERIKRRDNRIDDLETKLANMIELAEDAIGRLISYGRR